MHSAFITLLLKNITPVALGFHYFSNFVKVETRLSINDFVDRRLFGSFTMEGMKDLIRLMLQCMSLSGKWQQRMETVVLELERIYEKEMTLTTGTGEATTQFTLGSQLFTSNEGNH